MSERIYDTINKLYGKVGFLEKYGGSLWMTIILVMIFFVIISYFYVLNNIQPIKADWVNQRCKPNVMPFAGIINPPPNQSAFDFTAENFTGCIQNILTDIIGIFLAPFYYIVNSFSDILDGLKEMIQEIRTFFDSLRKAFASVSEEVMGRLLNFLIPLQQIFIKIKNMFAQTQGIMTAGIFTLLGVYQTLIAAVGSIVEIIVVILLGLSVLIIIFFSIPFGFGLPFAIPLLIIFILILVPGIMVYIVQVMILKTAVSPLPGIPSCFGAETLLKLDNGTMIQIKDIKVGMELENEDKVTAIFKLACMNDVYNLNGVICTGCHKVKYNNNWIEVSEHPESILYNKDLDYVYCINTNSKVLNINNITFGDYDELDNSELDELSINAKKYVPGTFTLKDIHKYLDGGFVYDTQIELQDGHSKNIEDVQVNDILRFDERVIGVVKIEAKDLSVKRYNLENNVVVEGGPNLNICDADLGIISTLDLYGENIECDYVYHLITDKRTFIVNGVKYYDYNSCIDKFLETKNIILLKALL